MLRIFAIYVYKCESFLLKLSEVGFAQGFSILRLLVTLLRPFFLSQVVNDCKLGEKKNVNVPGVKVEIPVVGEREIKDIEDWAVPNNADYIALSCLGE